MDQQQAQELNLRKERALQSLNHREQLDHAILLAEEMLYIDSKNKDAVYILAEGYFKKEDYPKASHYFSKVLKFNPQIDWVQFGLGASLLKVGRGDYALGHLMKAVELNPTNPEYYNGLGEYFFQEKNYDKAILCFEKAYSLGTDNLDALNNYGLLLSEHKRDPKEALAIFRGIIEKDPHHRIYRKNFIRTLKINHPLFNFFIWKKHGLYLALLVVFFYFPWTIYWLIAPPSKMKSYMLLFGLIFPALFALFLNLIAGRVTQKKKMRQK